MAMAEDDPTLDGQRRERLRRIAEVEDLRKIQALGPTAPPAGLTDAQLGQRLAWDSVAALTRGELVGSAVIDVLVEVLEEKRRENELKMAELDLLRRKTVAEESMAAGRSALMTRVSSSVGSWLGQILFNDRVQGAAAGLVVAAIALLTAYLFGMIPVPNPPNP